MEKKQVKESERKQQDNTVLAFVTCNEKAINQLFDSLKERISAIVKRKENKTITCVDVPFPIPLCENLSQIIDGWAFLGWEEAKKSGDLYDKETRKEMEIGAIAFIKRMIIVRKGNRCVTYAYIAPGTFQDMSPCIGVFSSLYLDLCSGHSPVFKLGKEKDRHRDFRCIPYISSPMSGLSAEDWLRLLSNYMMFAENWSGICCPLEYKDMGEEDDAVQDSAMKTIVARRSPVTLPDITEVLSIDPTSFLDEEEGTENNNRG